MAITKAEVRKTILAMSVFKDQKMDLMNKREANYQFQEYIFALMEGGEITERKYWSWMEKKLYVIPVKYEVW